MKKVLCITGPTASGKTNLSIQLAKKYNAEIISADSRQIYKHINIATAAPSTAEMDGIRHHFINELELTETFTAGDFSKSGRERIKEIFERGKEVIITGGSGLYLKALIEGIFENDAEDLNIRKKLYEIYTEKGGEYLYNELNEIDTEAALKMDFTKYRRVIRALEVFYATGVKISELQKNIIKPDFEAIEVGLLWDRQILYKRINDRVVDMIENGLIEEIKELRLQGYHYKTHNSLNTVGVKEVFKYLEGEYTFEEMINYIKQNTRRYAKRQMTWFRKNEKIVWIEGKMDINSMILEIEKPGLR